ENASAGLLTFFQTLFRQPRGDSDRRRAEAIAAHLRTRNCPPVPLPCGKAAMDNRQNPSHPPEWQNHVSTVIKEQLKAQFCLIFVVTQIPVHENYWPTKLIATIRISACLQD